MNPTAFIPRQALRRGARLRSADGRSFAVDAAAARRASPMAASPQALLPPPQTADEQKLVVVLDMDLTMIEARQGEHPLLPDSFRIKLPEFNNVTYTVHKRPGLDAFLAEACTKYELVAFTAGTQPYATQILDHLDPKSVIFRHRLYRQHCRPFGPFLFTKDLSVLNRPLSRVVLVDDSPVSFFHQLDNGIPVPSFNASEVQDPIFSPLSGLLDKLSAEEDVRPVLSAMIGLRDLVENDLKALHRHYSAGSRAKI